MGIAMCIYFIFLSQITLDKLFAYYMRDRCPVVLQYLSRMDTSLIKVHWVSVSVSLEYTQSSNPLTLAPYSYNFFAIMLLLLFVMAR